MSSDIDLNKNSQRCFVYPEMKHMRGIAPACNLDMDILLKIAKAFDYIISGKYNSAFKDSQTKYLNLLSGKDLLRNGAFVDVQRLKVKFREFYGESLLKDLGSAVDDKSNNWLPAIFRQHVHLFHPIRHILVLLFLAGSVERFSLYRPDGSVKRRIPKDVVRNTPRQSRIDWETRDRETLSKVRKAVNDILLLKSPFVRLTVHSVCHRTDEHGRILKSLSKLPLTMRYLSSIAESHLQFQYRKVDSVISATHDFMITAKLIYKEASIAKRKYKEVDYYISRVIAGLAEGKTVGL
jgi:hypothetical protein